MPTVPAKLGRYEVLSKIAKGGMAEVYRAKATGIAGFERILAVKRILPKLAKRPRFIRSFIDEARIAVSLNHRNIVQVVDFGKSDGELFLAMELIDGVDLRTAQEQCMSVGDTLPVPIALHILADVASGLEYAHRKDDRGGNNLGIVHCDISPQNIMLSMDGFVKILDFGVARAGFTGAPDERRLRGKPRYMAPEQTRGDKPTSGTDVFALGIVAWEVLTGRRLFDGDDLQTILRAVRKEVPPLVADLNAQVPKPVSDAIAQALRKKADERGSAADLATVFARHARDLIKSTVSQALQKWLLRLFPRPELDHTETNIATPMLMVAEMADDTEIVTEAPSPAPTATGLLDERRVVVVVANIDGGSEASQADLRRSLGMLAFKHGAVVQEGGDLTAVFGLEVVGEDDVASALHFGLDAVELARETASGGDKLGVRIAALAGARAIRNRGRYQLVGEPIHEARTLAEVAHPGRPLLAGGLGPRATARFQFRERNTGEGEHRLLELIGPTDFDARARALHNRSGRFFGRKHQVAQLEAALVESEEGPSLLCVGVVGEAGIGKSRLIAEFVASAAASRRILPSVAVAATPEAREAPFALVGDVLQAALGMLPGRGEAARSELAQRLRFALSSAGLDITEVDEAVDAIDRAMALRDGARLSSVSPPPHLLERVTAVLRRLRGLSAQPSTRLLILEDLQNADATSLETLAGALMPPQRPGADLVILSARDISDLPRDHLDALVELSELDGAVAGEMLRDRITADSTDMVLTSILRNAGGNPLFIEELAKDPSLQSPNVDTGTVRNVIMSRVSRLSSSARAVLQYASVVGRSFRLPVIDELVRVEAADGVGELVRTGLIEPADTGGDGDYQFRHVLIRDTIYESLAQEARAKAHAHVGDLLANRYAAGRDEPPGVIARHLALGGHGERAAEFSQAAGAAALGASNAAAAVSMYMRAIEHYRGDSSRSDDLYECLVGHAKACLLTGAHDKVESDLVQLAALAREGNERAEVATMSAQHAIRTGDFDAARAAADAAALIAEQIGDRQRLGEVFRIRAEASERLGDYDRATDDSRRALELFQADGDVERAVEAGVGLGRIYLMQSRYRDAEATYAPVLQHLQHWSDPWVERLVKNHVAVIELCVGNFEAAWEAARESLSICEHYADRARAGDNHSVSGIILSEVGMVDQAAECFEQALAIQDQTKSRWARADCLVYAGLNDFRAGREDLGRQRVQEALEMARQIGARYIEANALCALTELLLESPTMADLSRTFDAAVAAVEIGRETGLISAEILAQSRLAQATARTGDIGQALIQSADAVDMLAQQDYIEGCEEEVYFVDYQLKARVNDILAPQSLHRAKTILEHKLAAFSRPEWRASYANKRISLAILSAKDDQLTQHT